MKVREPRAVSIRIAIGVVVTASSCVVGAGTTTPDEAEENELATLEAAASCVTLDNRSLIETDPRIVNDARFSMERVFEQIRTTTPADATPPARATALFRQIYNSHSRCASTDTIDPNNYGLECRSPEASLGSLDPFTGVAGNLHFRPVALLNRFDLAPTTFATCGESRLVFWKDAGSSGRASIIVELRTPPVTLADGTRSCRPIAEFWASLSTISDLDERANKLEQFYFQGLPGMPFPPVSARGAGFGGAGQIRVNSFIDNAQWNLRELKYQKVCTAGTTDCTARMVHVSSKNNPSDKLFAGTHPKADAFQDWFIQTAVPRLARATTIHDLGLGNENGFNTFESVSQVHALDPTSVRYRLAASDAFKTRINRKLSGIGSSLTAGQILDRATTQTCGGCHTISSGDGLGAGMTWPQSQGFTHINESGSLSTAMTNRFLPRRKAILGAFVCAAETGNTTSEEMSTTISGRDADAPH